MINLVYFSIILGLLKIFEYSAEDAKIKKFISYATIAVMFIVIGITFGRAGL